MAALADLALRRPWALLAANLAVLALAVILAVGSARATGHRLARARWRAQRGSQAEPDLVIATTGRTPVALRPLPVALRVISPQLRSDAGVASVRSGPDLAPTALDLADRLPGSPATTRLASGRSSGSRREIDPGPLRVAYGGEVAAAARGARTSSRDDLWKLELLVVPLALPGRW